MKLVLLSGGSGQRLWPLSNNARSKQFLQVLKNENDLYESMVQRVWGQLKSAGLSDYSIIAANKAQKDIIQNQLGSHIPLILEPERRDTFAAIALAATYLYSNENISPDEVICILPVDCYVEEKFFQNIRELENRLLATEADLALIGAQPTYPSSKYGYMIPEYPLDGSVIKISHFKEKPTEENAQLLIVEKALWNCGAFAFKLSYVINILKQKSFPTQYEELLKNYGQLPKISFDYEVVEKANHIIAVKYDGYWKDLGTWNTLTEEMAVNVIGKASISEDSFNTHVVNEMDIPLLVLGVSNVAVVAGPNGILVTEKSASPRLKELLTDIDQSPLYEEALWGWYKVLDYTKYTEEFEVLTKRIKVNCGKSFPSQLNNCSKVWTFLNGEGEVVIEEQIYRVKQGDVLQVPVRTKHSIIAISDLELIEVQRGTDL